MNKLTKQEVYLPVLISEELPLQDGDYIVLSKCDVSYPLESYSTLKFFDVKFQEIPNWINLSWLKKQEAYVLSEEELNEYGEGEIKAFLEGLMGENPVKFTQVVLSIIAKDFYKSNVRDFTFSQEQNVEDGKRIEVKIKGTIKPI
jgi:hypothetical protein